MWIGYNLSGSTYLNPNLYHMLGMGMGMEIGRQLYMYGMGMGRQLHKSGWQFKSSTWYRMTTHTHTHTHQKKRKTTHWRRRKQDGMPLQLCKNNPLGIIISPARF